MLTLGLKNVSLTQFLTYWESSLINMKNGNDPVLMVLEVDGHTERQSEFKSGGSKRLSVKWFLFYVYFVKSKLKIYTQFFSCSVLINFWNNFLDLLMTLAKYIFFYLTYYSPVLLFYIPWKYQKKISWCFQGVWKINTGL